MLEHLAEITAIDPAIAGRTSDEMVGLVLRGIAAELTDVLAARDHGIALRSSCAS